MEYMHAQDLEHSVEGQRVPLGAFMVEEHVNKEMDSIEERIQTKEQTELMSLKKALHHYKSQKTHLNHLNYQLVNANRMIRKYIEEINSNYVELVQVVEEAVKRRYVALKQMPNYSRKIKSYRRKCQRYRNNLVEFGGGTRN